MTYVERGSKESRAEGYIRDDNILVLPLPHILEQPQALLDTVDKRGAPRPDTLTYRG